MKEKIEEIVIEALKELNEDIDESFEYDRDMVLIGSKGVLDSMDLVSLTILIEEKLSDELDISLSIVSEKAFSRTRSPFYNINSLVEYILEIKGD